MSVEDYNKLLSQQNGVCAICGRRETSKRSRHLAVDHDHETNMNRGLLCSSCNRGIGFFQENKDRLKSAANYLERYGK